MGDGFETRAGGVRLDERAHAFDTMIPSSIHDDIADLRARLDEDGYLFLRDLLDPALVEEARRAVSARVFGRVDVSITRAGFKDVRNGGDLAEVRAVVSSPELRAVCATVLAGAPMAFDYVWTRVVGRGESEPPHCDTVYMNRGTRRRLTAWIPLMDIPLEQGPLMVLRGSHRDDRLRRYRDLDIDVSGDRRRRTLVVKHGRLFRGFHYSRNSAAVAREFDRPWLSADVHRGDVVLFSTSTLHATLDNQSDRYRISLDARFQRADDPADERYVGTEPTGHRRSRASWVRQRLGRGTIRN